MDHDLGQRAIRRENDVWELSVASLTAAGEPGLGCTAQQPPLDFGRWRERL